MAEPNLTPPPKPPGLPMSPVRRLGVGVALVALPVGAAVTAWMLKQNEDRRSAELEKGYNYDLDVQPMRQVDPALVKFKEAAAIPTGMDSPQCMAVAPGGRILVAGSRLVRVLDRGGAVQASFAIPGDATAIAGGPDGVIVVAMKDRVAVYRAGGQLAAEWQPLASGSHVTSIAVARDAVYLADAGRRVGRVLKYDPSGRFLAELAREDAQHGIPGIITPSPHMDLALTPEGNLWVANPGRHQLELYSPDGALQMSWGSAGTAIDNFVGCCNPSDFALMADGRIVTAEKGLARVKVYRNDGHFQSVVATPQQFGGNRAGLDLAGDSAGRVLVLEPSSRSIRVFEPLAEEKS